MSENKGSFNKVLNTGDVLVVAFGAMIGWGWVVSSGQWIQSGGVLGTVLGFIVAMLVPYDVIMNYVWVISGWVGLGVTIIMIARVIYNRVKYGKGYGLPAAE